MKLANAIAGRRCKDRETEHAIRPALPKPGEGHGLAVLAGDVKRHFWGSRAAGHRDLAPLVEAARRDKASPRFPRVAEGRFRVCGLKPRVDRSVADFEVLGP